jgi:hypothetical protein
MEPARNVEENKIGAPFQERGVHAASPFEKRAGTTSQDAVIGQSEAA